MVAKEVDIEAPNAGPAQKDTESSNIHGVTWESSSESDLLDPSPSSVYSQGTGTLLINSAGSRRGSVLLINGRRGSTISLLQLPVTQQMDVRRTSIAALLPSGEISLSKPGHSFHQLTHQQSERLAKKILYKGQYRILNISTIFIILMIVFGIVFMSAWHYHDKEHEKFWVLYVALGVVGGTIGANLLLVYFYFIFKRYNG